MTEEQFKAAKLRYEKLCQEIPDGLELFGLLLDKSTAEDFAKYHWQFISLLKQLTLKVDEVAELATKIRNHYIQNFTKTEEDKS